MDLIQGTKFSHRNMVLYKSLGSLLKDYRQWGRLSQERLAESIGVSVRELRNWEANRRRAGIENLHDISEVTGIPMWVCVALNAEQPIWYSLRKRLFMYSSKEEEQFSSYGLFNHSEKSEDNTLMKKVAITKDRHIDMILSCHQDLYGSMRPLRKDVIKAATLMLPDLNYIMLDSWNHYVAHEVCLPIKMDVYRELKKQKTIENYLTSEMISDIIALGEGVLFYYTAWAANVSTLSRLIWEVVHDLSKIKQKDRYLFASHAVTEESAIIHKNLGMKLASNYVQLHNEVNSAIYETTLDFFLRPNGPMRYIIERIAEDALTRNTPKIAKQVCVPASLYTKPSRRVSFSNKYSPGEMAQPDVLNVDKNAVLTVGAFSSDREKQKHQNNVKVQIPKIETDRKVCPNTKCTLYANPDKSNIISNGTFRTKDGTILHRFICKECGKSFCSRTSSIFKGLRSPDEKVIEVLKLLVKGLSLRGVAKIIGVEFRTARSWLKLAAEHSEKINAMLTKELEISQVELDSLWSFVKNNSLRERANSRKRREKAEEEV